MKMGKSKEGNYGAKQIELAQWARLLSHPARVTIIEYLVNANSCVNKDFVEELGLAQSTVSQHLKELKDAGLIKGEINGVHTNYCVDIEVWSRLKNRMEAFLQELDSFQQTCC